MSTSVRRSGQRLLRSYLGTCKAQAGGAHLAAPQVGPGHDRAAGPLEADGYAGAQRLAQRQHGPEVLQVEGHVRGVLAAVLVVLEGPGRVQFDLRAQAALLPCADWVSGLATRPSAAVREAGRPARPWQGRCSCESAPPWPLGPAPAAERLGSPPPGWPESCPAAWQGPQCQHAAQQAAQRRGRGAHLLSSLASATSRMGRASSSMEACRISHSMQGTLYCFCRPAPLHGAMKTGLGSACPTRRGPPTVLRHDGEGQLVLRREQLERGLADALRPEQRERLLRRARRSQRMRILGSEARSTARRAGTLSTMPACTTWLPKVS